MKNVPATFFILMSLLILILFLVGIVYLQIYLSKKQNKWFGLILPIITFSFSIMTLLSIATFHVISTTVVEQTITASGEVIENVVHNTAQQSITDIVSPIFTSIYVLIIYNIPTVILGSIYLHYRNKRKKALEIEKMNIQDL